MSRHACEQRPGQACQLSHHVCIWCYHNYQTGLPATTEELLQITKLLRQELENDDSDVLAAFARRLREIDAACDVILDAENAELEQVLDAIDCLQLWQAELLVIAKQDVTRDECGNSL